MRRQDVAGAVLAVAVTIVIGVILHDQPTGSRLNRDQRAMANDAVARIELCEKFLKVNGIDSDADEDLKIARVLLDDFRVRKPHKDVIEQIEKCLGAAYERARARQE